MAIKKRFKYINPDTFYDFETKKVLHSIEIEEILNNFDLKLYVYKLQHKNQHYNHKGSDKK